MSLKTTKYKNAVCCCERQKYHYGGLGRVEFIIGDKNLGTLKTIGEVFPDVLNTNTKKFHYPTCGSVNQMADKNKLIYTGSRSEVISMGYVPCKNCNP